MIYLRMIHESLKGVFATVNKIILVVGVCLAITGFFIQQHNKDFPTENNTVLNVRTNIYDNIHALEKHDQPKDKIVLNVFKYTTCLIMGEACTNNPSDGDKNFNTSLLGYISTAITIPYSNPPTSGIAWLHDSLEHAGFVPQTYAAGIGFYSLSSFNKIWKIFRNITFFIMAIAIVIVGFLIMFRVKIDAQTVISLENSLPRIIVTLLLITFSYAIAGFLVDFMYILIMLAISLLGNVKETGVASLDTNNLRSMYLTNQTNIFSVGFGSWSFFNVYIEAIKGVFFVIPTWIRTILYLVIYIFIGYSLYGIYQRITDNIEVTATGSIVVASLSLNVSKPIFLVIFMILATVILPIIIFWIIPLLLAFLVLLALFARIFFMLIRAYVQVIINVIFAPILILPNVIPGNDSFMTWFKRVFGNLMAFPLTIILLITIQLIALNDEYIGSFFDPSRNLSATQFSLPLVPLTTSQIVPIIAGVFLLIIPTLVQSVVDSIAGEPITKVGVGTLISGVGGAASTAFSQYSGLAALNNSLGGSGAIGKVLGKVYGNVPRAKAPESSSRESNPPPGPDLSEIKV